MPVTAGTGSLTAPLLGLGRVRLAGPGFDARMVPRLSTWPCVSNRRSEMDQGSAAEHERLAALIGSWRTEGWTREMPDAPAARIDALDTYEWLPGGFGLLHKVDARVGDESVNGGEIIGYDPDRDSYVTQYFGSDGATAYEASLTEEGEGLVWRMHSRTTRFAGVFSDDGSVITGQWELLREGGDWEPWMDITLTRQDDR
jgi:Protein of unknown function (DUF1579)